MDDLGRLGEDAAAALYLKGGYRVLRRNWRCGLEEIDLVVARGSVIVFCEGLNLNEVARVLRTTGRAVRVCGVSLARQPLRR